MKENCIVCFKDLLGWLRPLNLDKVLIASCFMFWSCYWQNQSRYLYCLKTGLGDSDMIVWLSRRHTSVPTWTWPHCQLGCGTWLCITSYISWRGTQKKSGRENQAPHLYKMLKMYTAIHPDWILLTRGSIGCPSYSSSSVPGMFFFMQANWPIKGDVKSKSLMKCDPLNLEETLGTVLS